MSVPPADQENDPESCVVPDYAGACISNVVPALLEWPDNPGWLPSAAVDADQVVLLVLDGLGWEQLQARTTAMPTLSRLEGGPITSVAPSTTAAALTSIATGLPPGEHGLLGYRLFLEDDVVNMLRWSTDRGDARAAHPPRVVQPHESFCGQRPAVVTRAEFATTGFTQAHLSGTRFFGYRLMSSLVTQVVDLVRAGEPFVYAYYEGIDKAAHEYGLGRYYLAELQAADHLVEWLLRELPAGTALVVTADHGQVETGTNVIEPHSSLLANTAVQSGEGRFRWLHARPGRAGALLQAAQQHHCQDAWVRSRAEAVGAGWFGPRVSENLARRLGDVCMVAKGTKSFHDPADSGPFPLVGRHGSLTSAEMLVPLLVGTAG